MAFRRHTAPSYEGDPLIPIMNLVCLLIPLLLFGAVFVRFVTIEVSSPKIRATDRDSEDKLDLQVLVTDRGFHFKVNPKYRQDWMTAAIHGTATGVPDIPKKDKDWDFKGLALRLRQLKEIHRQEISLILSAEDHIAYQVVIKAMDYSRGTDENPLFPDITLAGGAV